MRRMSKRVSPWVRGIQKEKVECCKEGGKPTHKTGFKDPVEDIVEERNVPDR